jgi:hypothetical protein
MSPWGPWLVGFDSRHAGFDPEAGRRYRMQTPIRVFVAFTRVVRDAAMSSEAMESALHHLQELANSHGSPAFCRNLDDFMARLSQHCDLQTELEPLVSALKRLQKHEPVH